jgi:hypothetical protein
MPGSTTLTAFETHLFHANDPRADSLRWLASVMEEAIPHQIVDEIWGEMFHHIYLSISLSI